jgi:hypothetical protein
MERLPTEWTEHPGNPLIQPPWPEFVIADPTFLPPDQTPDGRFHLFAHGLILGIHHFVSSDGIHWERLGRVTMGMRPFLVRHEGYWLFFERLVSPVKSKVCAVRSDDLATWSRARTVVEPSLPWEGTVARTNGNPCVVRRGDEWWLWYSAGLCWLKDCGFPEPLHVGLARAPRLEGPWRKHPDPVLSPSPDVPHRNLGAGALKVLEAGGRLWGFNNGIYTDAEGRSRSDIRLLTSDDGLAWSEACGKPLVAPSDGWKRALVYAQDVRLVGGRWWMFYNARDGWFLGRERIGLATAARVVSAGRAEESVAEAVKGRQAGGAARSRRPGRRSSPGPRAAAGFARSPGGATRP